MFNPIRPNLVFSSIDESRALLLDGLGVEKRQFDVVTYVYQGSDTGVKDVQVDFSYQRPGYKFQNFYHFSQLFDISRYKAIWLVDEDIIMPTHDINKMFSIFNKQQLQMAQPAYDRPFHWELCLVDHNYLLRYTNFVENGVVIMSSEAARKCLESMRLSISGWGVDFIWPKLCGFPDQGIAIIDEVVASCPRVASAIDETISKVERETEGLRLMHKFNAAFFVPKVTGGILRPPGSNKK